MTNEQIKAIKLTLIQEHQIATRGWTDEQVIAKAAELGIIDTATAAATIPETPEPAPQQPEPQPKRAPQQPAPDLSSLDAFGALGEAIKNAIEPAISHSQPQIDESAVRRIVEQYSQAPRTVEVRNLQTDKAVNVGVTHECFDVSLVHVAAGNDLFFYGRSGSGKSTTAKLLAKSLDRPLFIMGSILSKFETLGSVVPKTGEYIPSVIRQWLESDNGVLCIDEFDASDARALVTIMALFDRDGSMSFADGKTLQRKPDHQIIVTANTTGAGANSDYVGRMRLDAATKNRFVQISHDYSDNIEKSLAPAAVVNYARKLRDIYADKNIKGALISPRTILQAGKVYSADIPSELKAQALAPVWQQGVAQADFDAVINELGELV